MSCRTSPVQTLKHMFLSRLGLSLLILAILSTTIEHADAAGEACSVSAQDCDKDGSMVYYCNQGSGNSGTCRLCWDKICTSSGNTHEKKKCGCNGVEVEASASRVVGSTSVSNHVAVGLVFAVVASAWGLL